MIEASENAILSVTESVIDYAVERIQRIIINTARHALNNLPIPKI